MIKRTLILLALLCSFVIGLPYAAFAEPPSKNLSVQYSIKEGKGGGDCTLFGIWDAPSKTCTMTKDILAGPIVYNTWDIIILIEGPGITLNGNGHSIIGTSNILGKSKTGIAIVNKHNITVENLVIKDCAYGVFAFKNAKNNIIRNNTITGTDVDAVSLIDNSSDNKIYGNDMAGGIYMGLNSNHNELTRNTIRNGYVDIRVNSSYNYISDNLFINPIFLAVGQQIDSTCINNVYTNNNIIR